MAFLDPKQVSTQDHLDIDDIRDNLVILKSGKVSAIIETTSLNFDLLANNEQDARIYTFAGLLNSLNFPIQIVIRTQQTDASKYLKLLEEYKQRVSSEALGSQVSIYQEFITNLTQNTVILNKRFYIVVPTITLLQVEKTNPIKTFFGKDETVVNIRDIVEKAQVELGPKVAHIIKDLANMGLAAKQMTNDELIKLYYSVYEPDKIGLEVISLRDDQISGAVVNSESQLDDFQAESQPGDVADLSAV